MKKVFCLILALLTLLSCCCTAFAADTTEPIHTPLKIIKQPESTTVKNGDAAIATVEAEGEGLSYMWFCLKPSEDEPTAYSDSNTLSMIMDETTNGSIVWCEITDNMGNKATSDKVTLSMNASLHITKQPVSVSVKAGEKAVVTIKAEGEGLTYKWYYKNPGASKFSYTSTFKSSTYTISSMSADRSGRQVYCVVTDKYGNTAKTDTVTISMKKQVTPLKITKQPSSVTVKNGQTAKVSVKAQGDGLTYKWYFANKGKTKFSKASCAKSTYSAPMDSTRNGRKIYCVISDAYGNSVKTKTVTINMAKEAIKITKQPKSAVIAEGCTAKFTIKASGEGLKYQWYCRTASSTKFYPLTSYTSSTYTVEVENEDFARSLYCVVKDKHGNTATSDTATLSVAKITKQPKNVTAANGKKVSTSVEVLSDKVKYQWYFKDAGASKFSKSSNTTKSYSTTMNSSRDGRQIYCNVIDSQGNVLKSKVVTLSMEGSLKISTQPTSVTVPQYGSIKVTVKASGEGLTYQWYYKDKGSSKFKVSSIKSGTYSTTMNSSRNGRQLYCVVKDAHGNKVKSKTVTIKMVAMPGKNSVNIPGIGINHKFTTGRYTQSAVDKYNILYTLDLGPNDPFILGHRTGTMGNLSKTKVGQYIYLAVNGKAETYKVVVSEYGVYNPGTEDIIGRTTGTSIYDSLGGKTLHLYTCYGSAKNGRWIVLAKKVS